MSLKVFNFCRDWNFPKQQCRSIRKVLECVVLVANEIKTSACLGSCWTSAIVSCGEPLRCRVCRAKKTRKEPTLSILLEALFLSSKSPWKRLTFGHQLCLLSKLVRMWRRIGWSREGKSRKRWLRVWWMKQWPSIWNLRAVTERFFVMGLFYLVCGDLSY